MNSFRGIIVKALSGFYYVATGKGATVTCRGRGVLKSKSQNLLVGDMVSGEIISDGEGVINEVLKRKNSFIRPPVANVDTMVVVASATVPKANPYIIDKFIAMAKKSKTEVVLCINKADTGDESALLNMQKIYSPICQVIAVSCKQNRGINELKSAIAGCKVAFAGPSGVGKSSIIRRLCHGVDIETGELSEKTKRGKHTTRHVEIFDIGNDTMVYDTPGFTSFDLIDIHVDELKELYDEFTAIDEDCKYRDCLHRNEPECAVRDAVNRGDISKDRYESYLMQIHELEKKQNNRY